ncbi:MAG: hypothetical protein EOP06_06555 [Proteobacteria bacterium]|nr:MAG: hypothetical protein EOP06_06555 [Pseudomonadota bacterium]
MNATVTTDFEAEQLRLRKLYKNEPLLEILHLPDSSLWYGGEFHLLYPNASQFSSKLSTVCFSNNANAYWKPDESMFPHMRKIALCNSNKLIKPTLENQKQVNPNFKQFPVGYDASLSAYEIDDTVRIESIRDGAVTIQRANYLDQLATNLHPDETPEGMNSTLRQSGIIDGRLCPFSAESPFANTIGACAVLIDKHGIPLLRYRGRADDLPMDVSSQKTRMAVMEKGWHCGASGVVTWQDLLKQPQQPQRQLIEFDWLLQGVQNGILREIREETGLLESDGMNIVPLAFARELKRAGKPNFFFVVRLVSMSYEDMIQEILARSPTGQGEYDLLPDKPGLITTVKFWLQGQKQLTTLRMDPTLTLSNIARSGFQPGQDNLTGFTYENYMAMTLAARWQRNSA